LSERQEKVVFQPVPGFDRLPDGRLTAGRLLEKTAITAN
jgi:hypothetical protein